VPEGLLDSTKRAQLAGGTGVSRMTMQPQTSIMGSHKHNMEQSHRGIKQRDDPMRRFRPYAAARFCTAHDELRDYFRYRRHLNEMVSLADQRRLFMDGAVVRDVRGARGRTRGRIGEIRRATPCANTCNGPIAFRVLKHPLLNAAPK